MVEPNILATWFPWVSSIGMALQAGFWEECLFRAVPIAGAALIGQKFGRRNLFIIITLILQAVIFGAGHANYAQQPSYARIVEIFLPAILYGVLFIRFGLFVGIISHFVYDAVLMSLPLFIQSSQGIWFDSTMVILLTAIPLFIILIRKVSFGKWGTLSSEHFNSAWTPALKKVKEVVKEEVQIISSLSVKTRNILVIGV